MWTLQYLPDIGGLEIFTHSLAQELQKAGHTVMIITSNPSSMNYEELSVDGIIVHRFPFRLALLHYDLKKIISILNHLKTILKEYAPDLVNIHGWYEYLAFFQTKVLVQLNSALCLTIHGLIEQEYYTTSACKKLWSMAQGINTVSNALLSCLVDMGWKHPHLNVIYNGIHEPQAPLVEIPLHPTLLMIGRLSEEKCYDVAFYAVKKLISKGIEVKLLVVGEGPEYENLCRVRQELDLNDVIDMVGTVQPHGIYKYIDRAQFLLVPSRYESFSLVVMEAALRGRPTIASHVHGLKETVQTEKSGLLVTPKDPDALAAAIERLLKNRNHVLEMGAYARQRALNEFLAQHSTKQYLQMYEMALMHPKNM